MTLTLAAIGAVVAALLELTVLPYLRIGGAQPGLVLVFAIVWTVVSGIEGGLIWAFIGGLMIDTLAPRPLGSTAFVLLLCVGGAAFAGRALGHLRAAAPVLAVLVSAFVSPLMFAVIYGVIRGPVDVPDPIGMLVPGALYSTAVGAIVGPLAFRLVASRRDRDRIHW